MTANTKIEWADHTFNGWTGCQVVSPEGCKNCYAAAWAKRAGRDFAERKQTKTWGDPVKWDKQHAEFFAEHGRRQRVFAHSLGDWLDNHVPASLLADFLDLVRTTENLDWLLLTKRIGTWRKRLEAALAMAVSSGRSELARWIADWLDGNAPAHVSVGATMVNQPEIDRDYSKLMAVPARVRFLSIEPMLGPISLRWLPAFIENAPYIGTKAGGPGTVTDHLGGLRRVDWVICGGESGPGARPMHPDWTSTLRDQCAAAGVPFMFKQWGEWRPVSQMDDEFMNRLYKPNRAARLHEDQGTLNELYGRRCTVPQAVIQADGTVVEPLSPMAFRQGLGSMLTFRVGKKAAGRLLDGIEHNGFPRSTT